MLCFRSNARLENEIECLGSTVGHVSQGVAIPCLKKAETDCRCSLIADMRWQPEFRNSSISDRKDTDLEDDCSIVVTVNDNALCSDGDVCRGSCHDIVIGSEWLVVPPRYNTTTCFGEA